MSDNIKENIRDTSTWKRVLFIVIFWLIFNIVELLIGISVLFQVIALLFTGTRNQRVLDLGGQLSRFAYDILKYVTFNSDQRPFPFSDWDYGSTPNNQDSQNQPS